MREYAPLLRADVQNCTSTRGGLYPAVISKKHAGAGHTRDLPARVHDTVYNLARISSTSSAYRCAGVTRGLPPFDPSDNAANVASNDDAAQP